jgi:2-polyprenyl-3-methyl-5-hydroxy-6-metoxy-1,4-benzoquinol methylase
MSKISEEILIRISNLWPSPEGVKEFKILDGEELESYNRNYPLKNQFLNKIKQGVFYDFYGKKILEIGCGHGGISTFLALNGARKVVGIDLNTNNLMHARNFAKMQSDRLGSGVLLPVEFLEMNAYELNLENSTFDIVLADNVFEHFMKPNEVMAQAHKVLKPGGRLIVPIFSSVYSKYAMHLKVGLKLPWLNIFFSQKTIVNALYKKAQKQPILFDVYPGLKNRPNHARDVRPYGDLNDITYTKFKKMALESGYTINSFETIATKDIKLFAAIIRRIPFVRNSILADIFSTGARAILIKN